MNIKPELTLHPGFPKCATSSVQHLITADRHALLNDLGYAVLGQRFRPNNGYPEVSAVMYEVERCELDVRSNAYLDEKYFLSNEAIQGRPDFVEILSERFDLNRCVFTIRLPWAQALSSFRYSGWLGHTAVGYMTSPSRGSAGALCRMRKKMEAFRLPFGSVAVCPVEGDHEPFEARFLRTCFPSLPEDFRKIGYGKRINESIGLAFAQALAVEVKESNICNPSGADRARFVEAAKRCALPEELKMLSIPGTSVEDLGFHDSDIQDYFNVLNEYGCSVKEARSAADEARKLMERIRNAPVATQQEMRALGGYARTVVESVSLRSTG